VEGNSRRKESVDDLGKSAMFVYRRKDKDETNTNAPKSEFAHPYSSLPILQGKGCVESNRNLDLQKMYAFMEKKEEIMKYEYELQTALEHFIEQNSDRFRDWDEATPYSDKQLIDWWNGGNHSVDLKAELNRRVIFMSND